MRRQPMRGVGIVFGANILARAMVSLLLRAIALFPDSTQPAQLSLDAFTAGGRVETRITPISLHEPRS